MLDGELVVPDSAGRSDFGELQRRSLMRRLPIIEDPVVRRPAALVIFDVLQADGADLRPLPLSKRKARAHVAARPGLHVIEGVESHGEALFVAMVDQGFHEETQLVVRGRPAANVAEDQACRLLPKEMLALGR